jgi:tetratricopeptide (TPR) repeat protein
MLHASQARRFLAPFAATLAALLLSLAAVPADDPRLRAEMLASQAEKILNGWTGEHETILQAEKLIEEALALDPDSGHAMVEKGRAILMSDPDSSRYSPRQVQAAGTLFMRAAQLKPPYGRGFVLLGHLHTETGLLQDAARSLSEAERLVPNDPWLKLNWSAYYAARGQYEKQAQYAEEAIATGTTNPKALRAAYDIVLKSELTKGNRERADAIYARTAQRAQPQQDQAWARGNYARNVIMYFGDFDAGEKLAREALAIMDYGHARQTLSLALYGQWAQAAKDGKSPAEQEALFEAANRNDPGGRHLPECAMNSKRVGFVFEAVAKKGIERRSLQRC